MLRIHDYYDRKFSPPTEIFLSYFFTNKYLYVSIHLLKSRVYVSPPRHRNWVIMLIFNPYYNAECLLFTDLPSPRL